VWLRERLVFRRRFRLVSSVACWLATGLFAARAETYTWRNVVIGGGGFVTGIEFHPAERGLAYARTDVGGAYRWDAVAETWVPLLDWLGQADWNLQGVESLALDPSDPERVYLAVGTYTRPNVGNAELLSSADRGSTWRRTPLPFQLGANEAARGSGERLVVDPHSPNLLYLGTRRDGLWRSADQAVTWARVAGFPDLPDGSAGQPPLIAGRPNHLAQPVGIVWVRLDAHSGRPGEPTPVIYAAVSRTGESIFRSTDAGCTWNPLPKQPTPFRPTGAALAPDGTLYVTYADEPGPSRMRDGALWRFSPRDGRWTDLTPEKPDAANPARSFGYANVAVDPADSATLLVTTWSRDEPGEEIFRSTDGGHSWRGMLANAKWDHSSAPYIGHFRVHWMSDVAVDPFNRDRVVFNTGYGLWASVNATAVDRGEPVQWVFHNRGLEETVPLALISPTEGAHLLSGLGDIDGFVHDDFTVSPPESSHFPGPRYKNTEWLDYAALAPRTVVRSGTTYRDDLLLAAVSDDGGRSWTTLATEPQHPGDKLRFAQGPVAISADGAVIAWTPRGGPPFFTSDRGRNWRAAHGVPADVRLVGDRVDPATFYGYDSNAGRLYVGTSAGDEFVALPHVLPAMRSNAWRHNYGDLAAVPDHAGECWLAAGGKLHAFTRRGARCREFPGLADVGAVGFGRAAPGTDYPAVFVTATVEGVHGIYRSDDAGATWVRLTDAAHQFGSVSHVTGDPRVFGRVYLCTGGRGVIYGECNY
jgi:photosystem II stability/assembly factor-like uncharacterized protein